MVNESCCSLSCAIVCSASFNFPEAAAPSAFCCACAKEESELVKKKIVKKKIVKKKIVKKKIVKKKKKIGGVVTLEQSHTDKKRDFFLILNEHFLKSHPVRRGRKCNRERGKRKEEGGRRKEEGGRRKE